MFGNSGAKLKKLNPTSCIPYKNMFLVSDRENSCIRAFDQSGTVQVTFGRKGNQDGQFMWPQGILLHSSNNILVCDYDNDRVQQLSLDDRFTGKTITCIQRTSCWNSNSSRWTYSSD